MQGLHARLLGELDHSTEIQQNRAEQAGGGGDTRQHAESGGVESALLPQLAAVKRIQGVARKKFGLLEAPMAPAPTPAPAPASAGEELRIELDEKEADDDYDWNKELDSRRKSGSLKLGFVEESGVMKEEIIGTDGGALSEALRRDVVI
jgi:hypothetical protein